jgi:excinuclease ABC subunit A
LVGITGVSGSGKTTLVREILLPLLSSSLRPKTAPKTAVRNDVEESEEDQDQSGENPVAAARVEGVESLDRVVLVDQSILSKTPRSNPAVYVGAFDEIRALFATSELARQRGLKPSAFSFNSREGQCERCRGAGFEKIEMQFLSDVFIRCPDCDGRRYRQHILDVQLSPDNRNGKQPGLSIADVLDSTVEQAIDFLSGFGNEQAYCTRPAIRDLRLVAEVGLGYLKLGQPLNTLSGGESQRLKLVRHLTAALGSDYMDNQPGDEDSADELLTPLKTTLFLFDEPTTGLHFDDVRVLLKVFQRLVDAGHSVIVIEHNLDVIKSCDWLIDLGPDAGDAGGRLVAQGTPEDIMACGESHTGKALKSVLPQKPPRPRTPTRARS